MGRGRTTRVASAWADTAFWADEDEDGALRSGKTAESHSKAAEKVTGSAAKKSKDKKKRRELVDKRLSDSGFELRSEEGAGEAAALADQEASGDAHDHLWDAVQKGKGKIYRMAEEKVRVGPAIPRTLVEMFAESFSLEVVETVFESTGHNTEATVKALLSMTSDAQPTEAPPVISRSPEGASSSKGPELTSDEPAGLPNLWDDLPEECKQLVLEKLSPLDAARAARVCQDFAAFVRSLRAKTTALAVPTSVTKVEHIMGLLQAFPNVSSLSFRKCRTTLPPPARWSVFHRLHVQNERAEGAKPIRSIDFGGITNVDSFDLHVLCQNRDLTHLDLSNTNLDDGALKVLAQFPVSLPPSERISPSGKTESQSSKIHGLQSLDLAGCLWISDAGLVPVIESPNVKRTLEVLDISNCTSLTRGAVKHLAVRTLVAVGMTWERFVAAYGPEKLLQDLNLAQSAKLAEVNISSPNLVNLNLSGCSALTKLDLRCPNLETLKLAQCSSLEELGEMQCASLKTLSMFQCRQLTADAMSDVLAGAPLLSELNCSGCSALFRLDLAANCQLTRLDVSGCNRLRQLTVASPLLTSLSARGCRSLVELRLDSQQVEQLLLNNCSALREVRLPVLAASAAGGWEAAPKTQSLQVDIRGCVALPDLVGHRLNELARRKWKA